MNAKKKIKILTIPNPILRQKSQPIVKFDANLAELVSNLTTALKAQKDPLGLGLSAPQIGVLKRVFVVRMANNVIKPFINPEIIRFSKKKTLLLEGCLSIPTFYGHVLRPAEIDVEAFDKSGKKFKAHYTNLVARTIQHELDHLNGILFIDHIHAQNGKLYKLEKTKNGKEEFVEVAFNIDGGRN